jgi:hypothetical protein
MNGAQVCDCEGTHLPEALHVAAGVNSPSLQLGEPHDVPCGYFWHPPFPSHFPFVEQAAVPLSLQLWCGSSDPAATLVHLPGERAELQVRQAPVHEFSQHTPSTQKPDSHWLESGHDWPFLRLPQMLPLSLATQAWSLSQVFGSLVSQVVVQAPLPQMKGAQSIVVAGSRHTPLPSQVRGGVSVRPEHDEGAQTVSAG